MEKIWVYEKYMGICLLQVVKIQVWKSALLLSINNECKFGGLSQIRTQKKQVCLGHAASNNKQNKSPFV